MNRLQLPEGFAEGLRRGVQRWSATSRRLAEQGWTVPDSLTPADVYDALEDCATEDEVDTVFVALFSGDGAALLETAAASLLQCQPVAKWDGLLQQTLDAVRHNHFLVAIPALLLVIEGVLAVDAGRSTNVRSMASARVDEIEQRLPDSITLIEWQAAKTVIDHLFANAPFTGDVPPSLNRHWVLHGRDSADWSQADCLRLISLLGTLCSLFEPLPV